MPLFKAPDGKTYKFNEYDIDFIVPNSKTQKKVDTQFNNELLTQPGWNRDHYSTRKKVYRDIVIGRGELLAKSIKYHKKLKPRKWYNW